jgi:ATP-dependent Clp protease ATP-binding subunit ClpA
MFERYTEKARRVIFFARYEASSFGSPYIESEHLLLGLLRDSKEIVRRYMDAQATVSDIRSVIESASIRRDPTSTSVDLPLSKECKRILAYSSEEAERLGHKHIGTEHLMLGILRETGCLAARLLGERGVQVDRARLQVAEYSKTWPSDTGVPAPPAKRHFRGFRVAERGGSQPLLVCQDLGRIPSAGEVVRIREDGGAIQSYRVQDVVWEFTRDEGVRS